ncbi:GNAT family N-acetyltransferase [bacterium]|nr:GNAT family N-acetyltransferase [bacterium]
MKLIPYKAGHARQILLREVEGYLQNCKEFDEWAKINEGPEAWSAVNGDNTVVACGGVRGLWEGVGEAWLLLGKGIIGHEIWICKEILKGLRVLKFHRVQANARVDFPVAHTFLHRLGFKEEGYMKMYYPDKCDAILYARTK